MTKRILIMLTAALLAAVVLIPAVSSAEVEMYVVTQNGKGLYARTEPVVADNIIKSLPYGTKVYVDYHLGNGWTCIGWGGAYDVAYVQTRFLSYDKPGPYKPSGGGSGEKTTTAPSKDSTTVDQMNSLLKNARFVTPYQITVRPTRASGWVYMRWMPSRYSEAVTTFTDGHVLEVIAEAKDWYQVVDPDSGKTGFVYKSYVNK